MRASSMPPYSGKREAARHERRLAEPIARASPRRRLIEVISSMGYCAAAARITFASSASLPVPAPRRAVVRLRLHSVFPTQHGDYPLGLPAPAFLRERAERALCCECRRAAPMRERRERKGWTRAGALICAILPRLYESAGSARASGYHTREPRWRLSETLKRVDLGGFAAAASRNARNRYPPLRAPARKPG